MSVTTRDGSCDTTRRQPSFGVDSHRSAHRESGFVGPNVFSFRTARSWSIRTALWLEAVHEGRLTRNAEVIIERPDGSRIFALVIFVPSEICGRNSRGESIASRNISQQKRIEEEVIRRAKDLEDFFPKQRDRAAHRQRRGNHPAGEQGRAELSISGGRICWPAHREFHADPLSSAHLDRAVLWRKTHRYPARLRARDGSIKQCADYIQQPLR